LNGAINEFQMYFVGTLTVSDGSRIYFSSDVLNHNSHVDKDEIAKASAVECESNGFNKNCGWRAFEYV